MFEVTIGDSTFPNTGLTQLKEKDRSHWNFDLAERLPWIKKKL